LQGAGTDAATSPMVLTGNTFSHAASGVSAGTYTAVTVDDKGHVTGGSNPGFITTEVDPIFTNHDAYSITSTDMSNWTSAYNDKIVSASVTGTTTKTITLTQQDGGTVTANWTDLQSQWTDAAEQFTGSTSNTINLSAAPSTQKHLTVSLNGQILTASDYSVSGTTLTLSNINRESDDYIIVYYSY